MSEETKKRKEREDISVEGVLLKNYKAGGSFYSDKKDNTITAMAKFYNRMVKTERIILVSGDFKTPSACSLIKVTIIQ